MGTKATIKRREQRKRAKQRLKTQAWYYMDEMIIMNTTNTVSLGCTNSVYAVCAPTQMAQLNYWAACETQACKACPTKEEENSMNTERNYLERRVREIFCDKERTLIDTFNLHVDNTPRTYKDLIAAIKDGKYDLDPKRTKVIDAQVESGENPLYFACGAFDGIIWKGDKMPDPAGYGIAINALRKARTTAMDIVQTQDAIAGLKALQDFDAWTPTGPAN